MTKLESGRSMVEMLGVLAIIGVLSIGGIAGYNMAMNRHKANNVVAAASQLLVLAETGATPSLTSIGNPSLDCTSMAYSSTTGAVTCSVTSGSGLESAINGIVSGVCDKGTCTFVMTNGVLSKKATTN